METGLPPSVWATSVVRCGDGVLPLLKHARPATGQVTDVPSSRGTAAPAQTLILEMLLHSMGFASSELDVGFG